MPDELKGTATLSLLIRALRPYQWVKNLFVLLPLLFGKRLTDIPSVENSLLAFAVFCCFASSLYIVNDCLDIEDDKAHPEKCKRPICSGALPVPAALILAAVALALGVLLAVAVGVKFLVIASLYFVLTLLYCIVLKRVMVIDAMTIATGFVLRVVGGAVAIGVGASHWLIVCTFLLAMFIAFAKRQQELMTLSHAADTHRQVLGQYSVAYLTRVNSILIGASIICYALYTVAPETVEKFGTDNLIYGTVFVVYGMLRYMALMDRSEGTGNPSRLFIKDKPLLLSVLAWAVYNALAIYHAF